MLLDYFFNIPGVLMIGDEIRKWAVLFVTLTMAGSVVGLTLTCIKDISKKTPGIWQWRVWMLIVMYGWLLVGFVLGSKHDYYNFLFNNIVAVIYQSMMGVTAFSLFTAFYRSLRLRNFDVALLGIVTIIVALGNVPIGEAIWGGFPLLRTWFFEAPVLGADRALRIVESIGSVAIGFRILIGKNRLWMGETRMEDSE
jgi:hypothetical protein